METQFHSECMENSCRVLSRYGKDLIYIENSTLTVSWRMEWREIKQKLGRVVWSLLYFMLKMVIVGYRMVVGNLERSG